MPGSAAVDICVNILIHAQNGLKFRQEYSGHKRKGPGDHATSALLILLSTYDGDIHLSVSDATRILRNFQAGDLQAADELLPVVYEELRRIAAYKMAQEYPGHTLQPTALVHEAWLRLAGEDMPKFAGRAHFFTAAAEAMRRILIEGARRRRSLKRGGPLVRTELTESQLIQGAPTEEMLAVNEALDLLAKEDPEAANLVKLRYFVGLTIAESAMALDYPVRKVERLWAFARAWLRRKMERDQV
jgi:RNA polymerase sigma factor (TIGR02999 family)